jgi:acyl-CoA synthetase (AMP-forming)/AMP-acid ligase II
MSVKIVDDEGIEMGPGDVGEVVARGPHVMSGYWQREGATAEVLRDGWLHTGDLAFRDPDGYMYLVDRRDDKIVTGGENVFPSEVERVLRQHPKVDDVAVIGIPDDYWGEAVCAVIVPAPDATWCTEEELARFVRQRVASYKTPKEWRFSSELPRNATGKVLRRVLRDEWSSLPSDQSQGAR